MAVTIGLPFGNGTIGISSNGTVGFSVQAQSFQTRSVVNTKLALYTLSIRSPNAPYAAIQSYTFPLSPSAISKEYTAMSNVYDVSGPAATYGVKRIGDSYGNSALTFSLEGTTGWKYHSTDGFSLTGNESIAALITLFNTYAQLNKQQQDNNNPSLYTMEFYDYFAQDYWRVMPVGKQMIRQNRERPLFFDYSFKWAGLIKLSAPPVESIDDPVEAALSTSFPQAISQLSTTLTTTLANYLGSTLGFI